MSILDFLGGAAQFGAEQNAATLNNNRALQQARAIKELEKEFSAQEVSETRDEQNALTGEWESVQYNQYGDVIRREPLATNRRQREELTIEDARYQAGGRKMALDEAQWKAGTRDEDRELEREATRAGIEATRASAARASREDRNERNPIMAVQDALDKLSEDLQAAETTGTLTGTVVRLLGGNSPEAVMDELNDQLENIRNRQDIPEDQKVAEMRAAIRRVRVVLPPRSSAPRYGTMEPGGGTVGTPISLDALGQ